MQNVQRSACFYDIKTINLFNPILYTAELYLSICTYILTVDTMTDILYNKLHVCFS